MVENQIEKTGWTEKRRHREVSKCILTTSTTRATDSRILADVHSTKPYSEDNMELRQSLPTSLTRVYNSVRI